MTSKATATAHATTISTAGLTARLRSAIEDLRRRYPRASARIIEPHEAIRIARAVRATLRKRSPDHVRAILIASGGHVANCYRYNPEADQVRVDLDLVTGEIEIDAKRRRAARHPHGNGPTMVGRLAREGQKWGSIVYEA